ncbi:MAG TPA: response regulator transcription factor [Nitrospirota bacterium]|nr:response regulator transcription factor [Nitrospirota bacterium]
MMKPTNIQTRILIVDDEHDLVELVTYNLTKAGFKISSAFSGLEALDKINRTAFNLIILDLMLPDLQGTELCRIIRNNPKTAAIPIIMLTAMSDVADRIRGIETGADDYLTKPFIPRELIARVNAVLRRTGGRTSHEAVVRIGSLYINKDQHLASKENIQLTLSATEFKLLLYLVERKGRVLSREQLLEAIWGNNTVVEPRTVDVHIRRLRMQIEEDASQPEYIKTRRGAGYYVDGE